VRLRNGAYIPLWAVLLATACDARPAVPERAFYGWWVVGDDRGILVHRLDSGGVGQSYFFLDGFLENPPILWQLRRSEKSDSLCIWESGVSSHDLCVLSGFTSYDPTFAGRRELPIGGELLVTPRRAFVAGNWSRRNDADRVTVLSISKDGTWGTDQGSGTWELDGPFLCLRPTSGDQRAVCYFVLMFGGEPGQRTLGITTVMDTLRLIEALPGVGDTTVIGPLRLVVMKSTLQEPTTPYFVRHRATS